MAVVADQPTKARSPRSFHLGTNALLRRPWILLVAVTSGIVAWQFQPDRTLSGLAKSFALPPLDVYSDVAVRTRGWGIFILLVLMRWGALAIIVSLLIGRVPSIKRILISLGVYAGAALSYAIPLNLGRLYLVSSLDERSSLPALAAIAAPFVLLILTRVFTQLLLKSFMSSASKVGWLFPALSVALWTLSPRLLQEHDITALGVLVVLVLLSVQALLLVSLAENFRAPPK